MTSDSIFFALVTYWHSAAELWSKTFAPLILPKKKILGQITWQRLKNKTKQKKATQWVQWKQPAFWQQDVHFTRGTSYYTLKKAGLCPESFRIQAALGQEIKLCNPTPTATKKKRQKSLSANILKGVVHPVILSTKVYTNNSGLPFCCQHSFSPNQKQH